MQGINEQQAETATVGLGVGTPRVYGFPNGHALGPPALRAARLLLSAALMLGLLAVLLPVFFVTFWMLLEATARLLHLTRGGFGLLAPWLGFGSSLRGWPADAAFLLAVAGGLCAAYLIHDHAALWGEGRAERFLWGKTLRYLEAADPAALAAVPRFFVEAYTERGRLRFGSDMGWLLVFPEYLLFVGDRETATLPRGQIADGVKATVLRDVLGLAPAGVSLRLRSPWGRLRLLNRQGIRCLSDALPGARRLSAALNDWLLRSSAVATPPRPSAG